MERMFGTSFADVRVHVRSDAAAIGATAYTQGCDIHFAPGVWSPDTTQGRRILGHELAHVVQQRSGRVRNPFGSGVAVVHHPGLEAEAERMGLRAATCPIVAQEAAKPIQRAGAWKVPVAVGAKYAPPPPPPPPPPLAKLAPPPPPPPPTPAEKEADRFITLIEKLQLKGNRGLDTDSKFGGTAGDKKSVYDALANRHHNQTQAGGWAGPNVYYYIVSKAGGNIDITGHRWKDGKDMSWGKGNAFNYHVNW